MPFLLCACIVRFQLDLAAVNFEEPKEILCLSCFELTYYYCTVCFDHYCCAEVCYLHRFYLFYVII